MKEPESDSNFWTHNSETSLWPTATWDSLRILSPFASPGTKRAYKSIGLTESTGLLMGLIYMFLGFVQKLQKL